MDCRTDTGHVNAMHCIWQTRRIRADIVCIVCLSARRCQILNVVSVEFNAQQATWHCTCIYYCDTLATVVSVTLPSNANNSMRHSYTRPTCYKLLSNNFALAPKRKLCHVLKITFSDHPTVILSSSSSSSSSYICPESAVTKEHWMETTGPDSEATLELL